MGAFCYTQCFLCGKMCSRRAEGGCGCHFMDMVPLLVRISTRLGLEYSSPERGAGRSSLLKSSEGGCPLIPPKSSCELSVPAKIILVSEV